MLSVVDQNKNEKHDIISYEINRDWDLENLDKRKIVAKTIEGKEIVLGTYTSEKRAKKVFEEMINAEEEQNSIRVHEKVKCYIEHSIKGSSILNGVSFMEIPLVEKRFRIYQMPKK